MRGLGNCERQAESPEKPKYALTLGEGAKYYRIRGRKMAEMPENQGFSTIFRVI